MLHLRFNTDEAVSAVESWN